MRMRKKPNLEARLARCEALLEPTPAAHRGQWLQDYPGYGHLYVELGCGKGLFTRQCAVLHPGALLVAVERVPDALVVAAERAQESHIQNIRFLACDVALLPEYFGPGEVSRLYLNFCDPWPKSRDAKHRLTAPDFLRRYADVLRPGGQLQFKTDNLPLFRWSLDQLQADQWALTDVTEDLHGGGVLTEPYTDYEAKFHSQGMPICRVVCTRQSDTKTSAAGSAGRLRNASLSDAHGYTESQAYHKWQQTLVHSELQLLDRLTRADDVEETLRPGQEEDLIQ